MAPRPRAFQAGLGLLAAAVLLLSLLALAPPGVEAQSAPSPVSVTYAGPAAVLERSPLSIPVFVVNEGNASRTFTVAATVDAWGRCATPAQVVSLEPREALTLTLRCESVALPVEAVLNVTVDGQPAFSTGLAGVAFRDWRDKSYYFGFQVASTDDGTTAVRTADLANYVSPWALNLLNHSSPTYLDTRPQDALFCMDVYPAWTPANLAPAPLTGARLMATYGALSGDGPSLTTNYVLLEWPKLADVSTYRVFLDSDEARQGPEGTVVPAPDTSTRCKVRWSPGDATLVANVRDPGLSGAALDGTAAWTCPSQNVATCTPSTGAAGGNTACPDTRPTCYAITQVTTNSGGSPVLVGPFTFSQAGIRHPVLRAEDRAGVPLTLRYDLGGAYSGTLAPGDNYNVTVNVYARVNTQDVLIASRRHADFLCAPPTPLAGGAECGWTAGSLAVPTNASTETLRVEFLVEPRADFTQIQPRFFFDSVYFEVPALPQASAVPPAAPRLDPMLEIASFEPRALVAGYANALNLTLYSSAVPLDNATTLTFTGPGGGDPPVQPGVTTVLDDGQGAWRVLNTTFTVTPAAGAAGSIVATPKACDGLRSGPDRSGPETHCWGPRLGGTPISVADPRGEGGVRVDPVVEVTRRDGGRTFGPGDAIVFRALLNNSMDAAFPPPGSGAPSDLAVAFEVNGATHRVPLETPLAPRERRWVTYEAVAPDAILYWRACVDLTGGAAFGCSTDGSTRPGNALMDLTVGAVRLVGVPQAAPDAPVNVPYGSTVPVNVSLTNHGDGGADGTMYLDVFLNDTSRPDDPPIRLSSSTYLFNFKGRGTQLPVPFSWTATQCTPSGTHVSIRASFTAENPDENGTVGRAAGELWARPYLHVPCEPAWTLDLPLGPLTSEGYAIPIGNAFPLVVNVTNLGPGDMSDVTATFTLRREGNATPLNPCAGGSNVRSVAGLLPAGETRGSVPCEWTPPEVGSYLLQVEVATPTRLAAGSGQLPVVPIRVTPDAILTVTGGAVCAGSPCTTLPPFGDQVDAGKALRADYVVRLQGPAAANLPDSLNVTVSFTAPGGATFAVPCLPVPTLAKALAAAGAPCSATLEPAALGIASRPGQWGVRADPHESLLAYAALRPTNSTFLVTSQPRFATPSLMLVQPASGVVKEGDPVSFRVSVDNLGTRAEGAVVSLRARPLSASSPREEILATTTAPIPGGGRAVADVGPWYSRVIGGTSELVVEPVVRNPWSTEEIVGNPVRLTLRADPKPRLADVRLPQTLYAGVPADLVVRVTNPSPQEIPDPWRINAGIAGVTILSPEPRPLGEPEEFRFTLVPPSGPFTLRVCLERENDATVPPVCWGTLRLSGLPHLALSGAAGGVWRSGGLSPESERDSVAAVALPLRLETTRAVDPVTLQLDFEGPLARTATATWDGAAPEARFLLDEPLPRHELAILAACTGRVSIPYQVHVLQQGLDGASRYPLGTGALNLTIPAAARLRWTDDGLLRDLASGDDLAVTLAVGADAVSGAPLGSGVVAVSLVDRATDEVGLVKTFPVNHTACDAPEVVLTHTFRGLAPNGGAGYRVEAVALFGDNRTTVPEPILVSLEPVPDLALEPARVRPAALDGNLASFGVTLRNRGNETAEGVSLEVLVNGVPKDAAVYCRPTGVDSVIAPGADPVTLRCVNLPLPEGVAEVVVRVRSDLDGDPRNDAVRLLFVTGARLSLADREASEGVLANATAPAIVTIPGWREHARSLAATVRLFTPARGLLAPYVLDLDSPLDVQVVRGEVNDTVRLDLHVEVEPLHERAFHLVLGEVEAEFLVRVDTEPPALALAPTVRREGRSFLVDVTLNASEPLASASALCGAGPAQLATPLGNNSTFRNFTGTPGATLSCGFSARDRAGNLREATLDVPIPAIEPTAVENLTTRYDPFTHSLRVQWTPPSDTGGAAVEHYEVRCDACGLAEPLVTQDPAVTIALPWTLGDLASRALDLHVTAVSAAESARLPTADHGACACETRVAATAHGYLLPLGGGLLVAGLLVIVAFAVVALRRTPWQERYRQETTRGEAPRAAPKAGPFGTFLRNVRRNLPGGRDRLWGNDRRPPK